MLMHRQKTEGKCCPAPRRGTGRHKFTGNIHSKEPARRRRYEGKGEAATRLTSWQAGARGLNGAAGGDTLAEAVASTSGADVRCELPVTVDGRHRNKTRSQAGCGSASLGIGAPAFAGTGQLARNGRASGARHEGAPGARTGAGQPGARGIDAAPGRCLRRAIAGPRGG